MTNQAEPMPFLPPIMDLKVLKAVNMQVAQHLYKLDVFASMVMFKLVTGFPDQPAEQRLAFYLSKMPIEYWLTTPQQVPTMQPQLDPVMGGPMTDPMTGQPVMATQEVPPISQLSPTIYQWFLEDSAKLIKAAQEKFLKEQAEQMLWMNTPL
jgi:hypothetical protein